MTPGTRDPNPFESREGRLLLDRFLETVDKAEADAYRNRLFQGYAAPVVYKILASKMHGKRQYSVLKETYEEDKDAIYIEASIAVLRWLDQCREGTKRVESPQK